MPVPFVDLETARARGGLRMVVVSGIPSPWSEAAKGILHVKKIPWVAVRLDQTSPEMAEWTGERSGPVAIYESEAPRSGWAEILLLAERLAPEPSLLPEDPAERALAFGLAHEICGEGGLGWTRRLQGVHADLSSGADFQRRIARYLGAKYGYRAAEAPGYGARVIALLGLLADRLRAQRGRGSTYYLGDRSSAVDVYSATFLALFDPLPHEQCPMPEALRSAFAALDPATASALDPILLEHRDRIYADHLELPLSL